MFILLLTLASKATQEFREQILRVKGDNNIPFILVRCRPWYDYRGVYLFFFQELNTSDVIHLDLKSKWNCMWLNWFCTSDTYYHSFQVGNKADLVGSRQVQQGTANGKAAEWNVRFPMIHFLLSVNYISLICHLYLYYLQFIFLLSFNGKSAHFLICHLHFFHMWIVFSLSANHTHLFSTNSTKWNEAFSW